MTIGAFDGGWQTFTVGDIADVIGGGTPSTKDPTNFGGGIPWLTPKDLSGTHNRYMSHGARNLTEKGLRSSSAKLVPPRTVLLTTRAPVGYVAIAEREISTNQGFRSLVVHDDVSEEYIYYWLLSNTEELKRNSSGSTFGELSGSALKRIEIQLPPLPEQRRIAHILGTLDDKIALNRRINDTLEEMARAMFKDWFVDFGPVRAKMEGREAYLPEEIWGLFPDRLMESELGEVPEGWGVVPLPEITDFREGPGIRHWQYTNSGEGTRFINIRCIQGGDLILDTANRVHDEEANGKYSHFHLREWDIVLSASGTLGRSAVVRKTHLPLLLNTSVIRFRPVDGVSSFAFLRGYLGSEIFLGEQRTLASGSVQKNFGPTHIKQMKTWLPSYECVSAYESVAGPVLRGASENMARNDALHELRDSLLPVLVSGKVGFQDANKVVKYE